MVSTRTRPRLTGRQRTARALIFISLSLSVAVSLTSLARAQAPLSPPMAKKVPKTTTLHGVTLTDEYGWLREKGTPEVTAYLEAENAYTEARTAHTAQRRETLYNELLGRIKETDENVPARDGVYWYYTRTEQGKAYPVYCRKKGTLEAPEEVYLDQNALAEGKKFHALGGMDVSPDGTRLLYLEDLTAFREYTLHVKDLATGRILESIPDVWNGTGWADDNRTFFYTRADAAKRGNTIWRHVVGTPADADVKVFEEPNVLYDVGVFRSRSDAFIFIASTGFTSSEWRAIPTAAPATPPRVIEARRPDVEYSVEHGGGFFYLLTNDGARNFRIRRAPDRAGAPLEWTDWAPHREEAFIEGVDVFETFAAITERRAGLRRVRIVGLTGDASHDITFPEEAYAVFPDKNPEFRSTVFRFAYSSPLSPPSVYDYDVPTRERTLRKRQEIPSGFDASRYEVHRRMAPARDGVQVPVSILLPKGATLDGSRPLLLYAYGSYGITMEPAFNANVLSLVDRGMIYAIAHVRGGQEMGRQWYDEGKMMKKMNTFTDFIDVGEHLVAKGYTRPDRLFAQGGSAGGLLIGAVVNLRADLFKGAVAAVPFVDVVTTMLDASIPLTTSEYDEWGNPNDSTYYRYMLSYSPYDNVRRQAYPNLLVTTG
ncbi:MAG TPA: S9 family peptidase, partial [Vicinamibacterales bacterium]|nr:S9 family peptidase [Vicinamibacterales bacterium]